MADVDQIDRQMIRILQRNGRGSNAQVAREVGVSEGTIRRRLKRLMQEELITVVAYPHPEKFGYGTEALVAVQVDPERTQEVASKLSALTETSWVAVTTGAFDIFTWVALGSSEQLGDFLSKEIRTVPGVRRTETFVSLNSHKRDRGIKV
jgi:Lrp/AsnC family transcriptional regulator for asnA, asnC and gidA